MKVWLQMDQLFSSYEQTHKDAYNLIHNTNFTLFTELRLKGTHFTPIQQKCLISSKWKLLILLRNFIFCGLGTSQTLHPQMVSWWHICYLQLPTFYNDPWQSILYSNVSHHPRCVMFRTGVTCILTMQVYDYKLVTD